MAVTGAGAAIMVSRGHTNAVAVVNPVDHTGHMGGATVSTPPPDPSASPTPQATASPTPSSAPAIETKYVQTLTSKSQPGIGRVTVGPSLKYGMATGDTLPWMSQNQLEAELKDIKSLGFGWVRLDLDWNDIQPNGASQYSWSNFDRVVSDANGLGLKLLPTIAYTAPWARSSACSSSEDCQPANPQQFATFAAAAVTRYAPEGIHNWEIWNEENNSQFWQPSPNAQAYEQLLADTYPQIKRIDPSATVVMGGMSPPTTGGIDQITYLTSVYADGGKPYFDAVGMHPYSFPVPASVFETWNAWSQMGLTTVSLRSIMIANGDSAKKIWATEYGVPTNGPGAVGTPTNYNFANNPDHTTEAGQAYYATNAVSTAAGYSWMGPMFWYTYQDLGTDTSDAGNFYGLIRADGSHKPAYTAIQQAILATE